MLYQVIEGRKLYSTGAMWFKVSEKGLNLDSLVALRKQQIHFYCGGDLAIQDALVILANDGIFKSYDQVYVKRVKEVVARMVKDGVQKVKP
jgi:hypothetical protein